MDSTQEELLKKISTALNKEGIAYMLTGAYAVIYYARPRASHDIDFVVELKSRDVEKIMAMFKQSPFDYMIQREAIEEAIQQRGQFNVYYLPGAVKLDFWIVKDGEFEKEKFSRRKWEMVLGQKMCLTTSEDIVVQKLVWYGKSKVEKHLVDAAFVWRIQKKLDKKYIDKWVKKLKLEKKFEKMKRVDIEEHY